MEGYAEARSRLEGERERRRRDLIALLLRDPPADDADLRAAGGAAAWSVPREAAALACREEDLDRIARRLPPESLTTRLEGTGCAVISDPEGPGRASQLARAAAGVTAALGPSGPQSALAESWALARSTLAGVESGAVASGGLVRADEQLARLLLLDAGPLVDRIAARRLAPLAPLTPRARRRMEETALAFVQHQGNAAAMARALGVHAQTARYRRTRLRELLGEQLDDPDARFELELALRSRA